MADIAFSLDDAVLSDADKQMIGKAFGLSAQDNIDDKLNLIAKAAFIEYLKMLKEGGMPSKAGEIMQERLFQLITNVFSPSMPSENQVETIFQIPTSQSRTLLKNVKSKYRIKLEAQNKAMLKTFLESLEEDEGKYEFECHSGLLILEFNDIVKLRGAGNTLIKRVANTASIYQMEADTYNLISAYLHE